MFGNPPKRLESLAIHRSDWRDWYFVLFDGGSKGQSHLGLGEAEAQAEAEK